MKKITSLTHLTTAEGERISFTFSEINEKGIVEQSNVRATMIVQDEEILDKIKEINDFLTNRLKEE